MTPNIASLWRYPLKAHGRESLTRVGLLAGQTMPWDRAWAVTQEGSKFDRKNPAWVRCANFYRGSKVPALMAINAALNEATSTVSLTHPDLPDLSFEPDTRNGVERFLSWLAPLMPEGRAEPTDIVRVPDQGLTDTDYPSISINSYDTLKSLSVAAGHDLSPLRWRGNIWLKGFSAWQEFDWIGRDIRLGGAVLRVIEPIGRCLATAANPETGQRDIDTLADLQTHFGHKNFGVYARVISSGDVAVGDPAKLIET